MYWLHEWVDFWYKVQCKVYAHSVMGSNQDSVHHEGWRVYPPPSLSLAHHGLHIEGSSALGNAVDRAAVPACPTAEDRGELRRREEEEAADGRSLNLLPSPTPLASLTDGDTCGAQGNCTTGPGG